MAARCASPAFRGGAFYPGAATVQPARLALGLRERLRARGVEVYEASPVPASRDGPGGVEARTAAGAVRAGAAVLAMGGGGEGAAGPLRNVLTVTSSHIVLTEPVPDLLEEIGWTGGECITDSRTLIDYFRTTPDGRILFGWGGGRIAMGARLGGRAELDPEVVALAAATSTTTSPASTGAASPTPGEARSTPRRPTCRWSCRCAAAAPSPPPATPATASARRTWSAGPSPRSPSTAATSTLACAFVDPSPPRVPPEPFHWIGGEAIRRGLMRKEEAELAGPRAGPDQRRPRPRPRADRLPHRPLIWRRADAQGVPTLRGAGTTSTGRSATCSSLYGVEPRITPFSGGSP